MKYKTPCLAFTRSDKMSVGGFFLNLQGSDNSGAPHPSLVRAQVYKWCCIGMENGVEVFPT